MAEMDLNTVIFDLLITTEQRKNFEDFQKHWMKKFDFKTMTFNHYFQYVRVLLIKNSQVYKKRKHNYLHVYVMEMIRKICLDNNIFKEDIEVMNIILQEKYLEININIIVYINPKEFFNNK